MSIKSTINISINKNVIISTNVIVAVLVFIAGFIRHIDLFISGIIFGMALMFVIIEFMIVVVAGLYLKKQSNKSEDE